MPDPVSRWRNGLHIDITNFFLNRYTVPGILVAVGLGRGQQGIGDAPRHPVAGRVIAEPGLTRHRRAAGRQRLRAGQAVQRVIAVIPPAQAAAGVGDGPDVAGEVEAVGDVLGRAAGASITHARPRYAL